LSNQIRKLKEYLDEADGISKNVETELISTKTENKNLTNLVKSLKNHEKEWLEKVERGLRECSNLEESISNLSEKQKSDEDEILLLRSLLAKYEHLHDESNKPVTRDKAVQVSLQFNENQKKNWKKNSRRAKTFGGDKQFANSDDITPKPNLKRYIIEHSPSFCSEVINLRNIDCFEPAKSTVSSLHSLDTSKNLVISELDGEEYLYETLDHAIESNNALEVSHFPLTPRDVPRTSILPRFYDILQSSRCYDSYHSPRGNESSNEKLDHDHDQKTTVTAWGNNKQSHFSDKKHCCTSTQCEEILEISCLPDDLRTISESSEAKVRKFMLSRLEVLPKDTFKSADLILAPIITTISMFLKIVDKADTIRSKLILMRNIYYSS